jgi:hypothetical protein
MWASLYPRRPTLASALDGAAPAWRGISLAAAARHLTTSGYRKSSFQFAEGKPMDLLSATHLL